MNYTITLDGNIIHSVNIDDLKIFNPKVTIELNEIGSFQFAIYPTNPYYSQIVNMVSIITVYQDADIIFKGRVIETITKINKEKEVYCESTEAYLIDTQQDPYNYSGSVTGLLQQFINNHNAQVGSNKQFTLGTVTVTDPNNYIARANSEYSNTWGAIQDKLVSTLGGYIVIRHLNGVAYIDYLASFNTLNTQQVAFGENMLSVKYNVDLSSLATVLIPLGAQDEDTGVRLTIESVNSGVKYLENTSAITTYGRIVKSQTWDDVTVASNLKTKGQAYLAELATPQAIIEISAIDMANINANVTAFKMYSQIKVSSSFHNIDGYFTPSKMTIDLFNQKNNKITLNGVRKSLTDDDRGLGDIEKKVENIINNTSINIPTKINAVKAELTSLIEQTATEITSEVSASYYSKNDNTDLVAQINTVFAQNSTSFEMQFNTLRQGLSSLLNDTNANFEDIRRYIRFINGNIILGEVGNDFSLVISNTKISFMQGQLEVAYISNSKLYNTYVEIIKSLTVGGFIFMPRTSGNLSLKKVGV